MPRSKRAGAPCQKCEALEAVILLQNGAMDEMGRIIEQMPGGAMAKLKTILARHGVQFRPEGAPLQ